MAQSVTPCDTQRVEIIRNFCEYESTEKQRQSKTPEDFVEKRKMGGISTKRRKIAYFRCQRWDGAVSCRKCGKLVEKVVIIEKAPENSSLFSK